MDKFFFNYDITSEYGYRDDPLGKGTKFHKGIDFGIPLNTEIKSNVSGQVITSGFEEGGFGNYVVIRDNDGKLHYYAHLNERKVDVGDSVNAMDLIGLSGSTGRSTGPHLHYEVRDSNNNSVDPSSFLNVKIGDTNLSNYEENKSLADTLGFGPEALQNKLKGLIIPIFKYIVIILLVVLIVFSLTKALDVEIL